ncbi:MAG TPA: hypothetical protein VKS22_04665 [Candidatus Binataceae bacterium]|nr:hypothetical protein [Candidatus Binataceae bacterium]
MRKLAFALAAFLVARAPVARAAGLALTDAPDWMHYFCDSSEPDPDGSASLQGAHCYPRLTVPSGATITVTNTSSVSGAPVDLPRGEWLAFVNGPCTIAGTINAAANNGGYSNGGGSGGGGGGAATTGSGHYAGDSDMFGGPASILAGRALHNPDFAVMQLAAGGLGGAPGLAGGNGSTPTAVAQRWVSTVADKVDLGGGGGGNGGKGSALKSIAGNGGGAVVLICADLISFTGTIDVNGGNGAAGTSGGGGAGGGGGGVVLMATPDYVANTGTIRLNGGAGAAGDTGAGPGGNGAAGWIKLYTLH